MKSDPIANNREARQLKDFTSLGLKLLRGSLPNTLQCNRQFLSCQFMLLCGPLRFHDTCTPTYMVAHVCPNEDGLESSRTPNPIPHQSPKPHSSHTVSQPTC